MNRGAVRLLILMGLAAAPGCGAPRPILDALKHPDPLVRQEALVNLRAYVRDAAKPEIGLMLIGVAETDWEPRVRQTAIRSLARFGGQARVRDALLRLLQDHDPRVRMEAAATLARWKDPLVREALEQRLAQDPEESVRAMALASLAYADLLGGKSRVREALKDPGPLVRLTAVRLCRRHRLSIDEPLRHALQRDPEPAVRDVAATLAGASAAATQGQPDRSGARPDRP